MLIDPSFQGKNILFVLLFENEDGTKVHTRYYLLKVKIKNFNVLIDGKNVLHRPVKSEMKNMIIIVGFLMTQNLLISGHTEYVCKTKYFN